MTGRRGFFLAVVGWLAIVAVGSTLVWTVVAQAGRDVGEPERETLAASSAPAPSESATESATAATEPPTETATETATVAPTETPTETPTDSPTDPATDPASGTPTQTPEGTPTGTTAPPPPAAHRRTWQGAAGRVIASCAGARISLVAAQPHSGWRVEVEDRGPEELSVKFELTEEAEDDRFFSRSATRRASEEVEVHARCVGGVPSFSLD